MADTPERPLPPPLVVLVGAAGAGKTTVGRQLAVALGAPFADGDDFHAPANIARMQQGLPLDDASRGPWLAAIHARLAEAAADGTGLVVACSALKHAYRQRLAEGLPALRFVHLDADRATLQARLQQRAGHFFGAGLLESQLAILEPLRLGLVVDARRPPAELAAAIARWLQAGGTA